MSDFLGGGQVKRAGELRKGKDGYEGDRV